MTKEKALRLRDLMEHLNAALAIADSHDEVLLGAKLHDCLLCAHRSLSAAENDG